MSLSTKVISDYEYYKSNPLHLVLTLFYCFGLIYFSYNFIQAESDMNEHYIQYQLSNQDSSNYIYESQKVVSHFSSFDNFEIMSRFVVYGMLSLLFMLVLMGDVRE